MVAWEDTALPSAFASVVTHVLCVVDEGQYAVGSLRWLWWATSWHALNEPCLWAQSGARADFPPTSPCRRVHSSICPPLAVLGFAMPQPALHWPAPSRDGPTCSMDNQGERPLAYSAKGQQGQSIMLARYLHSGGAPQWWAVGLWLRRDEHSPQHLVIIRRGPGSSKLLPNLSWSSVAASAGGCWDPLWPVEVKMWDRHFDTGIWAKNPNWRLYTAPCHGLSKSPLSRVHWYSRRDGPR